MQGIYQASLGVYDHLMLNETFIDLISKQVRSPVQYGCVTKEDKVIAMYIHIAMYCAMVCSPELQVGIYWALSWSRCSFSLGCAVQR